MVKTKYGKYLKRWTTTPDSEDDDDDDEDEDEDEEVEQYNNNSNMSTTNGQPNNATKTNDVSTQTDPLH
ncbi:unnamed protein product [Adineta ricciae]|uniref:Uncharacterized protein n=1 Tax=Adineta ricciae TaxID=249248 RepID=A0A815PE91_ADIRI|nr:unnamed protein product [Adineta ricciae]CAF1447620.1 unnamed protein product [Adineta ricciae]